MEQSLRGLIDTNRRTIRCPRCEEDQPMRDFATLGMSPLYAELLSPIFRCKLCNHLFAPRTPPPPVTAGPIGDGNGTDHSLDLQDRPREAQSNVSRRGWPA
jgi:hypothetical protein